MAEPFVMFKPNLTFENVFLYTLVRLDVPNNRIIRNHLKTSLLGLTYFKHHYLNVVNCGSV